MMKKARLVLEDGLVLEGKAFGAAVEGQGEVVFNTSHQGYPEILTDPSYYGQIVTLSAPQIGNVGVTELDEESARPYAAGLIVREAAELSSNWRAESTLDEYLKEAGIPGLTGLDTRLLVRHLRTHGSKRGIVTTETLSDAALIEKTRAIPSIEGSDLASKVSTPAPYAFSAPKAPKFLVAAVDYGIKFSILEQLAEAGCEVHVLPSSASATDILSLNPDGIFLSNGPGDPAAVVGAQETVRALLGNKPIFGICLGHQILALALGGKTFKLKFGHRGGNHPVKDITTSRIEITSQNHGFAVDPQSLGGIAEITHLNLNDGTVEGLAAVRFPAFSVQHHPEASPGPHDSRHLFGRFTEMMERGRG
jgi:carbamoyl-phosphate synthase small subunit